MTRIRSSGPKPASSKAASTKTAGKKAGSSIHKATAPKIKASGDSMMPRTNWKDPAKLGAAIDRAKAHTAAAHEHPRLRHTHRDPVTGGNGHHAPPIAMRYGLIRPDPEPVKPPPIAMRYGLIRPGPNEPPPKPPPIAMRYGLIRPRPGVDTEPRPGIKR